MLYFIFRFFFTIDSGNNVILHVSFSFYYDSRNNV